MDIPFIILKYWRVSQFVFLSAVHRNIRTEIYLGGRLSVLAKFLELKKTLMFEIDRVESPILLSFYFIYFLLY